MMEKTTVCIYIVAVLIFTLLSVNGKSVTCKYKDSKMVDGGCYRQNLTKVSWTEARDSCKSWKGKLATFTSIDQMAKVFTALGVDNFAWIGSPNEVQDIGPQWIGEHSEFGDYFQVYSRSCPRLFGSICIEFDDRSLKKVSSKTAFKKRRNVKRNNNKQETKKVTCLNKDSVPVDGKCYRLSTKRLYSSKANSYCNSQKGALANISSVAQGIKVLRAINYMEYNVWVNYPIKNDKGHTAMLYDYEGCTSYEYGYAPKDSVLYKALCVELPSKNKPN